VVLRERHRARVVPGVDDVGDTPEYAAVAGVARPGDVVDVGPVRIEDLRVVEIGGRGLPETEKSSSYDPITTGSAGQPSHFQMGSGVPQ